MNKYVVKVTTINKEVKIHDQNESVEVKQALLTIFGTTIGCVRWRTTL